MLLARTFVASHDVAQAEGVTSTVNSNADAIDANLGDGVCDDGAGNCTLRAAIEQAGSGDTIVIPTGAYTLALGFELAIDKNLTLTGAGAESTIIQAATEPTVATSRVLVVTDGNVVNSGLTVRHGNPGFSSGGGIFNNPGGTLTLNDSVVNNNAAAGGNGGGIMNFGTLDITRSVVSGNTAVNRGGGIENIGELTLIESTISANTAGTSGASISRGGGIRNGGTATLTETVVRRNQALSTSTCCDTTGGGGISNSGTLTSVHSLISGNIVGMETAGLNTGGGGGVSNLGSLTLIQSTVSENLAGDGGGIYNSLGTSTISGTTVDNNTANWKGGGGITNNSGTTIVTNSTISSNTDLGFYAGEILNFGTIFLSNSTLSNNTGPTGGIYNFCTPDCLPLRVVNTIIANSVSSDNCNGSVTSLGHNLDSDGTCALDGPADISGVDPLLGPLADNGDPTETHALLRDSPAIDHVPVGNCEVTVDQRGVSRPQRSGCDIGAFESGQADLAVTKVGNPNPVAPGDLLAYTIQVTNNGPAPSTAVTLVDILSATVDFVSAAPGPPTCTESAGTVTCDLGGLDVGDIATSTIVVIPTATGTIINIAKVTGMETDPVPANNTDRESTFVGHLAQDLVPITGLSLWGLVAMAVSVAAALAWRLTWRTNPRRA